MGRPISEETRLKISRAKMGHAVSAETRRKISEAQKGKTLSDEHKRKIGEASKGHPNYLFHQTEEARRKISAASRGHPSYMHHQTPEARSKIAAAGRGRKQSAETIRKYVATRRANGNYKHSEETRRKISEAQKGKTLSDEHKRKIGEASKGHPNYLFHQTEEARAKIREHTIRRNALGSQKETGIERKVRVWLDELEVNYIQYYAFPGIGNADFYIPALQLDIECDGEYWHRDKAKDVSKDARLAAIEIRVLRLSETEIDKYPEQCQKKLARYVAAGSSETYLT